MGLEQRNTGIWWTLFYDYKSALPNVLKNQRLWDDLSFKISKWFECNINTAYFT